MKRLIELDTNNIPENEFDETGDRRRNFLRKLVN